MRNTREHLGQSGTRSRLRSRISLAHRRSAARGDPPFKGHLLECILQRTTVPSLSTFACPLRISCRPCLFRGLPVGTLTAHQNSSTRSPGRIARGYFLGEPQEPKRGQHELRCDYPQALVGERQQPRQQQVSIRRVWRDPPLERGTARTHELNTVAHLRKRVANMNGMRRRSPLSCPRSP